MDGVVISGRVLFLVLAPVGSSPTSELSSFQSMNGASKERREDKSAWGGDRYCRCRRRWCSRSWYSGRLHSLFFPGCSGVRSTRAGDGEGHRRIRRSAAVALDLGARGVCELHESAGSAEHGVVGGRTLRHLDEVGAEGWRAGLGETAVIPLGRGMEERTRTCSRRG